jgi:hypothetical protein
MTTSEDKLVKQYIEHEKSPDGKWWVEVPVGLSVTREADGSLQPKSVDAVCLTGSKQELPERYPEHSGTRKFIDTDIAPSGESRADQFRRLADSRYFEKEEVAIVEAKTEAGTLRGIGQLQAYASLLEEDYGWSVEQQILLCDGRDDIVDHAADTLGIRVVHVR